MLLRFIFVGVFINAFAEGIDFVEEFRIQGAPIKQKCMEENNINQELIDNCHKGEFPENRDLKCYMKCVYEELGLFDDDGLIDSEIVLAIIPEEHHPIYEEAVRKCHKLVGEDMCETVFLTNKCYYEVSPETYFII